MAYLLDGAVILIFIIAVLIGWKRGLIRSVLGLVACILSLVLAGGFGAMAAGGVFDTFIAKGLTSTVAEHVPQTDAESVVSGVEAALGSLPDFVVKAMENYGIGTPQKIVDSVRDSLGGSTDALAAAIVTQAVRPAAVALLTSICFLILFIVFMIIFSILISLINRVFRLPVLKQLNESLGAVVGAVEGVLVVLIVVTLVQWGAAPSGSNAFITQDDVNHTLIVKTIGKWTPSPESFLPGGE